MNRRPRRQTVRRSLQVVHMIRCHCPPPLRRLRRCWPQRANACLRLPSSWLIIRLLECRRRQTQLLSNPRPLQRAHRSQRRRLRLWRRVQRLRAVARQNCQARAVPAVTCLATPVRRAVHRAEDHPRLEGRTGRAMAVRQVAANPGCRPTANPTETATMAGSMTARPTTPTNQAPPTR